MTPESELVTALPWLGSRMTGKDSAGDQPPRLGVPVLQLLCWEASSMSPAHSGPQGPSEMCQRELMVSAGRSETPECSLGQHRSFHSGSYRSSVASDTASGETGRKRHLWGKLSQSATVLQKTPSLPLSLVPGLSWGAGRAGRGRHEGRLPAAPTQPLAQLPMACAASVCQDL